MDGFYLGGTKNDIDPTVMTLFRESDRQVIRRPSTEFKTERGSENYYDFEDDDSVDFVRYACSAAHAIDRLELAGFTRQVAAAGFARGLTQKVAQYDELRREHPDLFDDESLVLHDLDLDRWIGGIRTIHDLGLLPMVRNDKGCESLSPLLNYMVCEEGYEWYGFPGSEHRHFLRLVLEGFDPGAPVVYDLTHLALGGWVDSSADLVAVADSMLAQDFVATRRVIVLTEGSTDSRVLSSALALVYPHLAEYFHFLDFEQANLGGGAGALANIVKAFAGAGIVNRTIALFDNDTAAHDAIRLLRAATLPDSLQVLTLPPLDELLNYPTLGPNGRTYMDINGLAGSLELYLGSAALEGSDGEPIPVQWKGYVAGLGRYQGELIDKRTPHDRYGDFVRRCERGQAVPSDWDWVGLRTILDTLRGAFHAVDAEEIEAWDRDSLNSDSASDQL